MSIVDAALNFFQKTERLIIVTLTITVAGVVAWTARERGFLDLTGLDPWVLPTIHLVWICAAVHVAIHSAIALWHLSHAGVRAASRIPFRLRKRKFDSVFIRAVRDQTGISREVICYALFRADNHIWVPDDSGQRPWLMQLRASGLVTIRDAAWGTTHYEINGVAWQHMKSHPNRFIAKITWPSEPWVLLEKRDVLRLATEQLENEPEPPTLWTRTKEFVGARAKQPAKDPP